MNIKQLYSFSLVIILFSCLFKNINCDLYEEDLRKIFVEEIAIAINPLLTTLGLNPFSTTATVSPNYGKLEPTSFLQIQTKFSIFGIGTSDEKKKEKKKKRGTSRI